MVWPSLCRRAALGLLSCLPFTPAFAEEGDDDPVFLSAYRDSDGTYGVAVLRADGRVTLKIPLPARGHGIVARPNSSQTVAIARRPGAFALVFDRWSGGRVTMVQAAVGRHFFGHGVFSTDGRLFYTTENDFGGERGVIGIYDAASGFQRIGEHNSYGIGPHELILMPDGETLAVANGGILTDPDLPRIKLNLADMQPSVALIDRHSGTLIREWRAPGELHQLSLRHLSANEQGTLAIAAQWEGSEEEVPPLVGLLHRDGNLHLVSAPTDVQIAMRHYCGSVAFNRAGDKFSVSSPRGGVVTHWLANGSFDGFETLADGSGVAPYADGTLKTSGVGIVRDHKGLEFETAFSWDNHLTATR